MVDSPERTALLRAILDAPEDDLPRLVYADWLEEQGDPLRAEFIRLQVERWRRREKRTYPQPLRDRLKELKANEQAWRAELPQLPDVTWGRYWRGFISEAKFANPVALIEQAATVFAIAPVRIVHLRGLMPDSAAAVFSLPQLSDLFGLRLDDVSPDLGLWRALTECPWFGRLRHLIAYPTPQPQQYHWGEQLVRLVLAAAARDGARLKIAHLELPDVDENSIRGRGRVWLTGLGPGFEPL